MLKWYSVKDGLRTSYFNNDDIRWILSNQNSLSDREKIILTERFLYERTLNDISNMLGITSPRVSQIILKSLEKIGFIVKKNHRLESEVKKYLESQKRCREHIRALRV